MADVDPLQPVAAQIADLATSSLVGVRLSTALREQFPAAPRAQVYLGRALAVSIFEADRLQLVCELLQAEARLAALQPEVWHG